MAWDNSGFTSASAQFSLRPRAARSRRCRVRLPGRPGPAAATVVPRQPWRGRALRCSGAGSAVLAAGTGSLARARPPAATARSAGSAPGGAWPDPGRPGQRRAICGRGICRPEAIGLPWR